jgi:hypothetical protein
VRRGLDNQDPLLADMRAMRASESQLEAARARIDAQRAADTPRIWPQHWHAVQVFMAMDTQWRTGPDGRPGGLDYAALDPVLREHRQRLPRRLRRPIGQLMPQLRALERAALRAMAE